jgi:putative redox protein
MSTMSVTFPGGKRVDASYGGFTVRTDQRTEAGGEGSAPSPFDLFLASIATCAGFYVKGYCDTRALSTEGLELRMRVERNPETRMVAWLALDIRLPEGFPERYRDGVRRAADLCSVKKHLQHPPAFKIRVSTHVGSPIVAA